jgi:hypothetical protein
MLSKIRCEKQAKLKKPLIFGVIDYYTVTVTDFSPFMDGVKLGMAGFCFVKNFHLFTAAYHLNTTLR